MLGRRSLGPTTSEGQLLHRGPAAGGRIVRVPRLVGKDCWGIFHVKPTMVCRRPDLGTNLSSTPNEAREGARRDPVWRRSVGSRVDGAGPALFGEAGPPPYPADRAARGEHIEIRRVTAQWSAPPAAERGTGSQWPSCATGAAPPHSSAHARFQARSYPTKRHTRRAQDRTMNCMCILECADRSFSVGSTRNLGRRLAQHHDGEGAEHTQTRRPARLVYVETFARIDDAYLREEQVQRWGRAKRLAFVSGTPEQLPTLSRKQFSERA
ncbi:GIY-YIG nuclease family protein [Microbacterium sp. HD4P20]|uniref:GIY-YIG nuclease family protein n=1 Tax=Microbacterium sp. HD4P20 TaxID=2864874 RepID=UPI0035ABF5C7